MPPVQCEDERGKEGVLGETVPLLSLSPLALCLLPTIHLFGSWDGSVSRDCATQARLTMAGKGRKRKETPVRLRLSCVGHCHILSRRREWSSGPTARTQAQSQSRLAPPPPLSSDQCLSSTGDRPAFHPTTPSSRGTRPGFPSPRQRDPAASAPVPVIQNNLGQRMDHAAKRSHNALALAAAHGTIPVDVPATQAIGPSALELQG